LAELAKVFLVQILNIHKMAIITADVSIVELVNRSVPIQQYMKVQMIGDKDGTKLKEGVLPDGTEVDAEDAQTYLMRYITLFQENVRNVKDFMMSLSALQYVQ
jgi:hypothetical protein